MKSRYHKHKPFEQDMWDEEKDLCDLTKEGV